MSQIATLKNQVLSRLLFDDKFKLSEEQEGLPGVQEVIPECPGAIYAINEKSCELSDREWSVSPKATPFQKLTTAFDSVRDEDRRAKKHSLKV